nr:glycine betaine ABC transporter substrate-binding protein [endosymbiont 'TC1' of Trimyema compressum]
MEYSGTAYGDVLKHEPISDIKKVYETAKKEYKEKYNIDVLTQFSFNNTYAIGVRADTAETYKLKTISDLQKVSGDLVLSATLEFLNREDDLLGLEKLYNLKFKKTLGVDGGPRYIALMNNESDAVDVFTTDGLIKKV